MVSGIRSDRLRFHSRPDGEPSPGDEELDVSAQALVGSDDVRGVARVAIRTTIAGLNEAPADAYDAYLRLHLISGRKLKPHGCNLDGVFGKLTNVVWTNHYRAL